MKFFKRKTASAAVAATARHYDVIVSPVITEKSTRLSEQNKVLFNVRMDANKQEVRDAVQNIFGVKVARVNMLVREGKQARFRNTVGKHSDVKRAFVTLAEGQKIDFEGGAK